MSKYMWGVQEGDLPDAALRLARLTVPAREALVAAGNQVSKRADRDWYEVALRRLPPGLVVVGTKYPYRVSSLRLSTEPEYPREFRAPGDMAGLWLPCPECGVALLGWEIGYALRWRMCLQGHACQLSEDGRSAERQSRADLEPAA